MRHRGWLLDPYIRERNVVYWFKTNKGEAIKVEERHNPVIVAKPKPGYTIDNLVYLFEEHPFVVSASPVTRYTSIHREKKAQYVEVKVDMGDDLDEVVRYGERLREVEELFNIGLIPIQWHLIYQGIQPSALCDFTEEKGRLTSIEKIDDGEALEPPPWKTMVLGISDGYMVSKVQVTDEHGETEVLDGSESVILQHLNEAILEWDPDIIVMDDPRSATRHLMSRARRKDIDLRFGRGGEGFRGRILLGSGSYNSIGL
ncbi:MAG: hypothetical protein ACERKS_07805, partial [Candidatus Bathyarchaeota archaeon]